MLTMARIGCGPSRQSAWETYAEHVNQQPIDYDGISATQLARGLKVCDLVISNTRVGGVAGLDLIDDLREHLPTLPILYLANRGRSTPELELELELPNDVPVLHEPFTAQELRTAVRLLLW